MNSVLRYVASGSKGTLNSLASEISSLTGTNPKLSTQTSSIEFLANQKQLLEVCYKSHLVENLKVQIGNRFIATDDRELMLGLKKLPMHAFIHKEIKINCKISTHDAKLKSTRAAIILERYLEENRIKSSINFEKQNMKRSESGLVPSSNELLQLLIQDRHARLYTSVNKNTMYKHGWKTNVNYAPLRESLAASILYDTGIIQKAKRQKSLKLWDPFCGSGTFILEALSLYLNLSVRQSGDWMACANWPCFDNKLLQNFKQNLNHSTKLYGDISLLGSDIDLNTINSTLQNVQHFKQYIKGQPQKTPFIQRFPMHKIFTSSLNQLYFAGEDFQTVSKQILTGQGMTVLTNLPFGHRSRQKMNKAQLVSVYKRFDKLLKSERSRFQNAFVLLPTVSESSQNHFISMSQQKWKLRNCYESGGKQVGLYELQSNTSISLASANIQPMTLKDLSLTMPQNNELALNVIGKTSKQMKVNTVLPKHLIPKIPGRGHKRVAWRRKVHEMKQDYKQYSMIRAQQQQLKQFQSQKIQQRKVKRGQAWKQNNIKALGEERIKSQKYRNKIQTIFEDKVKSAIVVSEKDKQRRRNKKLTNKGQSTHVRKW